MELLVKMLMQARKHQRQGIRDTDESENKVENAVDGNAKASSLEGVAEIGAIENCNGEGEKEVRGNRR